MPTPHARILVVEDDASLASAIVEVLSRGYEVLQASDAAEAIILLQNETVDLVLLDLILSRGTGFQVLEVLHETQSPPVLLMSGIGSEVDLQTYASLVVGRITKPFDFDTLQQYVRAALQGHRESRTVEHYNSSVLLVDDDQTILTGTTAYLEEHGYKVVAVGTGEEAAQILTKERFDVAVVDWILPRLNGVDLIQRFKAIAPHLPVLLVSGYATPALSQHAIEAGAADVLAKPLNPQALVIALEKCLQVAPLQSREGLTSTRVTPRTKTHYDLADITGKSSLIRRAKQELAEAAETDFNVLILGETGTGKEVFAHALHHASARANGPFVVVNAAAIPETLLEAELFGYAGGAFTGASREGKVGRFQKADKGTLFLDEIGDLPLTLQAKLLRVLQEGEIDVVGGATKRVDVRVVAATNRDLAKMVQKGTFRSDLYYRLNVITLHLPPLRERREDIPLLVDTFLDTLCRQYERPKLAVSAEAMAQLMEYAWPGNVRELHNAVDRAFVFARRGGVLLPVHLSAELKEAHHHTPGEPVQVLDLVSQERNAIQQALRASRGNKVMAAKLLGISRANLYVKLKAYHLDQF